MSNEEELARLREEMRELRQRDAILKNARASQQKRADNLSKITSKQKEKIKDLTEKINQLEKENSELKSRLGIETDKAKVYAGMIFKSNVRKRDEETENKRGGKLGHAGAGRKKPEHIDHEVNVHLTHCYHCLNPLGRTSSVDTRIVEEIPKITPIVTQYSIERQWCTHCHKEVRGVPLNTLPGSRFGMNVITTILFLKYRMRSPLAKIQELLSQHKVTITSQGIQELLHLLKTKFTKQYNDILIEIRNAPIKNADETGFRIDGLNGWCWLFATPTASFYTIEETRGKDIPIQILGHDPTGLLVRDDCPSYTSLSMSQQSCWAHLLRVTYDIAVHENASTEIQELHKELSVMFDELKVINQTPFMLSKREQAYRKYTKNINTIIARKYTNDDVKAIQTRIANQNTNLINALLHENAPLTNNHAERMIRPMVITRKISGGSRSDKGAATHSVNMSIIQTLSLKGRDFFTGITEILHAGNKRYALGNGG